MPSDIRRSLSQMERKRLASQTINHGLKPERGFSIGSSSTFLFLIVIYFIFLFIFILFFCLSNLHIEIKEQSLNKRKTTRNLLRNLSLFLLMNNYSTECMACMFVLQHASAVCCSHVSPGHPIVSVFL